MNSSINLSSIYEESGINESLKRLENDLIGLKPVKRKIREISSLLIIDRARGLMDLPRSKIGLHMNFTGRPGTGKTTVARRISKILYDLGYLSKGHLVSVTRDDLVGQYVGHTAPMTRECIKRAKGGVLFIDEAYYLSKPDNERDYGVEVVEILLQEMERIREDFVVIFAGYKNKMDSFFNSNPGLSSRIAHHIDFPDYTNIELMEIAQLFLDEQGYKFSNDAFVAFEEYIEIRRTLPFFANARSIRNAIERNRLRQANRLLSNITNDLSREDLMSLEVEDVKASRVFEGKIDQ